MSDPNGSTPTSKSVDPAESARKVIIYSRIFGVLCYAIMLLGVAMALGDVSIAVKSPISAVSTSTLFFGLFGAIFSEISARRAEGWAKKAEASR